MKQKYQIHISYSWGDEEPAFGKFDTKEEAWKEMCKLAAKEAYVQNEEFGEDKQCSVHYNAFEKKIDLHYERDNTWCYYRIKDYVLEQPMSVSQIVKETTKDDPYIRGNVIVQLKDMIHSDVESFLDLVSEKLCGSTLLMDIEYTAIDVIGGDVVLVVSGDASQVMEMDEEMTESLKSELFMYGIEEIEDFTDMKISFDDKDTIDSLLDDVIAQMPEDELLSYYRKYVCEQQI